MGKVRNIWSQNQTDKRILNTISSICSISIIILVFMQILGVWKTAINAFEPLLGVIMLIQAIQNWKKNRVVAIISLCAAILTFLVAIIIFAIK